MVNIKVGMRKVSVGMTLNGILVCFEFLYVTQMKATFEGKGLFHLTYYSPLLKEVKARAHNKNLNTKTDAKARSYAVYWFASANLLRYLS